MFVPHLDQLGLKSLGTGWGPSKCDALSWIPRTGKSLVTAKASMAFRPQLNAYCQLGLVSGDFYNQIIHPQASVLGTAHQQKWRWARRHGDVICG
jgi:hypothetical protein